MSFADRQRRHHAVADEAHYAWQTRGPYFAETEAALLGLLSVTPGERLLEIGCGEGGNLFHLRGAGARLSGVDSSLAKAAFAGRATGAAIACADAAALPYGDGCFDVVLIRDLLHHLPDRLAALCEAHRVLRPGGRLLLMQPNAWAPLVLLQALVVAAERGALRSTAARLAGELRAAGFHVRGADREQPLPLARVLLNPGIGRPRWGAAPQVARALRALSTVSRRVVPHALWLYLVYHAVRPST